MNKNNAGNYVNFNISYFVLHIEMKTVVFFSLKKLELHYEPSTLHE